MRDETKLRLINQAKLQMEAEKDGVIKFKYNEENFSLNKGFNLLPEPTENDLFFDLEGGQHTFAAMSSYKWNPNTEKPKPIHDWCSHPSDAVRYAIYTHQKMSNISIYA